MQTNEIETFWLNLEDRACVLLRGQDTADLLHRVTSQDTRGLAVGAGAPACILTGKGKMQAFFEVFRPDQDVFVLEVDRSQRDALCALLDRFIFAERIDVIAPAWRAIGVFGTEAPEPLAVDGVAPWGEGYVLGSAQLGVPSHRAHGPAEAIADLERRLTDVRSGDFADYEALRIDAGVPRFGVDVDESTIPLEAGLESACHPDKGCYIGQEVIARIHTYGHVNRKLCRVRIDSNELPEPGTLIYDEGVEAGRVTSAYVLPDASAVHALAMLPFVLLEADEAPELHVGAADGPQAKLR